MHANYHDFAMMRNEVGWLHSNLRGAMCDEHCASTPQGALKLATAALSKYRGDQLFRALKAHALERTGKTSEAISVRLAIISAFGCIVCDRSELSTQALDAA